ncbi:MAG: NTP transferase domain-containing protein [bacterium]
MDIKLQDILNDSRRVDIDEHRYERHSLVNGSTIITKAVIIAAGNGSRLNGYQNNCPKPLVKVGGVSLLERVILSAKKSGVEEFVIVIGYQAAKIRETISARKLGVKITWVHNDEWKRQNGVSVLKAEKFVDGKFFLFMSDHVFDTKILQAANQCHLNGHSGLLCIDHEIHRVHDLDDATKVYSENNRLQNLGKSLPAFNAIDTGIFVCTPDLFDALRQSQQAGDESLSGGIRMLAREGKMATHDIGDARWQDVDTVSDVRLAEKLLLHSTRSKNDGIIARKINRPISNAITKWLLKSPITPNQISTLNLLFSVFTAWFLAAGKPLHTILGGVFFQLASIFDGCDGEVAVIKHKASKAGALFDTIADHLSYIAFIIGVTIGTYNTTQNKLVFAVTGGIILFLLFALRFGFQYINKKDSGSFKDLDCAIAAQNHQKQQVWYLKFFGAIHHIGRRDMFSFLSFLIMLSGNIVIYYWLMITAIFLMSAGISLSAASMLSKTGDFQPLCYLKRMVAAIRNWVANSSLEQHPNKEVFAESTNSEATIRSVEC